MSENRAIAVAMSGGVDSSTVAALLARQGWRVVGFTMQLWNQRRLPELATEAATGRCCSLDDVYDARRVAEQIGIPFYVVNFERQFEASVVRAVRARVPGRPHAHPLHALQQLHQVRPASWKWRTPLALNASPPATTPASRGTTPRAAGSFSARWTPPRTRRISSSASPRSSWRARSSRSGEYAKPRVRELAREMGLAVAEKGDSQEICFVPNGDYAAFLSAWLREKGAGGGEAAGEIVSTSGETLGGHAGVHHFTVGQRRGLGIAAKEPLYVIATDAATQRVVVGPDAGLYRETLVAGAVNWVSIAPPETPLRARVKIRNKHEAAWATLQPESSERVAVRFDRPQRAVTPGQAAVFYDGDLVLGGGWIE